MDVNAGDAVSRSMQNTRTCLQWARKDCNCVYRLDAVSITFGLSQYVF